MALQKLFGLYVESVSKWLRIGHTEGVNVREAIIPGTPGGVHRVTPYGQMVFFNVHFILEKVIPWYITQCDHPLHSFLKLRPSLRMGLLSKD